MTSKPVNKHNHKNGSTPTSSTSSTSSTASSPNFLSTINSNAVPEVENTSTSSTSSPFVRISAGSYEGSLFGWKVHENDGGNGLESNMIYGFHCAPGPIKCMAVSRSGKYLACGCANDDKIRIFSGNDNKSLGELSKHSGSVTSLAFVSDTFLLSSSEDNTVCIWRCNDWSCLHVLEGHESTITAVAVHPSGKLAFTASKDKTLRMWNLVHGRCSFTRKLKEDAYHISFDADGLHYVIVNDRACLLFKVADNSQVSVITSNSDSKDNSAANTLAQAGLSTSLANSKINSVTFCSLNRSSNDESSIRSSDCIAIAYDNKYLKFYSLSGDLLASWNMSFIDGGRIRAISAVEPDINSIKNDTLKDILDSDDGNGGGDCLAVVTSVGTVALISIQAAISAYKTKSNNNTTTNNNNSNNNNNVEEEGSDFVLSINSVRAEPRLTCVAAWRPGNKAGSKSGLAEIKMGGSGEKDVKETGSDDSKGSRNDSDGVVVSSSSSSNKGNSNKNYKASNNNNNNNNNNNSNNNNKKNINSVSSSSSSKDNKDNKDNSTNKDSNKVIKPVNVAHVVGVDKSSGAKIISFESNEGSKRKANKISNNKGNNNNSNSNNNNNSKGDVNPLKKGKFDNNNNNNNNKVNSSNNKPDFSSKSVNVKFVDKKNRVRFNN